MCVENSHSSCPGTIDHHENLQDQPVAQGSAPVKFFLTMSFFRLVKRHEVFLYGQTGGICSQKSELINSDKFIINLKMQQSKCWSEMKCCVCHPGLLMKVKAICIMLLLVVTEQR